MTRAKLTTFKLARVLVGRFIVNANHSIGEKFKIADAKRLAVPDDVAEYAKLFFLAQKNLTISNPITRKAVRFDRRFAPLLLIPTGHRKDQRQVRF